MNRRRVASGLLALVIAAGCGSSVYFGDARPFPSGCVDVGLAEVQCQVLVDAARERLAVVEPSIERIELLTEDRCGVARDQECTTGVGFVAGVRFHLTDGTDRWLPVVTCRPGAATMYCPLDPKP